MSVLLGESFAEQLGGLGSLQGKFPGVVSLNVSDNPIDDVATSVKEIVTLMPNVKDLQISLYQEADVDLIMQHMPRLQILNNIPIEADDLACKSQSPPSEERAGVPTSAYAKPIPCEESIDVSERRLVSDMTPH